jgi:succinyl-CoA synthetase alpha subunit
MSEKRNDGGPAFPATRYDSQEIKGEGGEVTVTFGGIEYPGMTLRDYFAAKATDNDVSRWIRIMGENGMPVSREAAKWLYADEMLRERDR